MNSTTFLFNSQIALAMASALGCAALLYAACRSGHEAALRRACILAGLALALTVGCLVIWFRARFPGLETAPRPVQWQLGATLGAGALWARVTLARLPEIANAQVATRAGHTRIMRWQLSVAAALLALGSALGISTSA
ncbi:hypothetical protein [Pseudomonas sp. DC3000-4b1]|uniref:hypothetical protein n=1 Tax=unclassified Pseudomonas TaxID=196821 RepID=UPI003CF043D0